MDILAVHVAVNPGRLPLTQEKSVGYRDGTVTPLSHLELMVAFYIKLRGKHAVFVG